jgi:precorrin-2 dehydrogenase / sirohydrochlorin ferrochelatase
MSKPLFPIFLKLEARKCVIVGGGMIAEQKLSSLLEAGALVTVISPAATATIERYAREGLITWSNKVFEPVDLEGALLVIAATAHREIDEAIYREAERRGVLCNAVDDPPRCQFYYPSVIRRGDLQIAISTNGKSPALAQRLRKELEITFDATYEYWLEWLGRVRELYFSSPIEPQTRLQSLHRIASRSVYERFRESREARLKEASHG